MSFRALAARLSRTLAREGMRALLDGSRTGRSRTQDSRAGGAPTSADRGRTSQPERVRRSPSPRQDGPSAGRTSQDGPRPEYRGDWRGPLPATAYAPTPDGRPDPGEVIWAWVPFEEDHAQGKDRPALVIARHPRIENVVLALPLTSKDHDRDAAQEARAGRHWMDLGSGAWDRGGRPSEVRLDRVLQLDERAVRREGATLDEARFDEVVRAARAL